MFELPLWIQASFVFFFGGVFVLGCLAAMWVLSYLPSVERVLDDLLGGETDA